MTLEELQTILEIVNRHLTIKYESGDNSHRTEALYEDSVRCEQSIKKVKKAILL